MELLDSLLAPYEKFSLQLGLLFQPRARGFCRVAIPRELLWCDDIFDWTVRVNGTSIPIRIQEHAEHTYLYFTYSHSVQTVEVYGTQAIPEFSSVIILALFMTTTPLATIVYRRKGALKA